jgi:hypothetical protein
MVASDEATHQADLTLYPGASWVVSTAPVNVTAVEEPSPAGSTSRLTAFPNPTRGGTTIVLESQASRSVAVTLFDLSGRQIARLWSGTMTAGRLELQWDGRDQQGRMVANGVYLVRAETTGSRFMTRLLILR